MNNLLQHLWIMLYYPSYTIFHPIHFECSLLTDLEHIWGLGFKSNYLITIVAVWHLCHSKTHQQILHRNSQHHWTKEGTKKRCKENWKNTEKGKRCIGKYSLTYCSNCCTFNKQCCTFLIISLWAPHFLYFLFVCLFQVTLSQFLSLIWLEHGPQLSIHMTLL